MITKDETMLMEDRDVANQPSNSSNMQHGSKGSWKKVTFGTASGILVGAGAMYAAKALAGNDGDTSENQADTMQPEDVKVAKVSDGLSFQDAFDAARAQVGSGGVFRWNGGLYSTYKEDEWNAMSDEDKAEFAQAIRPEVRADEIVADRMSEMQPQVVVVKEQVAATQSNGTDESSEGIQMNHNAANNDVSVNTNSQQSQDINDGDVHVVGQGYVQGHQAVALDLTGNGEADVAIIDVNDNGQLDDPDVVVDKEGNMATMGQIAQAQVGQGMDDPNQYTVDEVGMTEDPNLRQTGYDDSMDSTDVDGSIMTDEADLNVLM